MKLALFSREGIRRNLPLVLALAIVVFALVAPALATTYTAQIDTTDVAGQAEADILGVFQGALPVLVTAIGLMIGWKYLKRFFLGV